MQWGSQLGFYWTVSSCKAPKSLKNSDVCALCRLKGEHWNFEMWILGRWMRMRLQNWLMSRLFCTLVQDGLAQNAWCNMESCSGKVQDSDMWDENLRVWGFVGYLWDVGSGWVGTGAWCNMESCSGKIPQEGCVRWKFSGLRFCGVSLGRWFRMGCHNRVLIHTHFKIYWYTTQCISISLSNPVLSKLCTNMYLL